MGAPAGELNVANGGSAASIEPTRAEVARWPAETERRDELRLAGVPCLLVVSPGAAVPVVGPGEDWVRSTTDERDVAARLAHLSAMPRPRRSRLDLCLISAAPAASDATQRVIRRLAAPVDRLVPAADLAAAASPGDEGAADLDAVVADARWHLPEGAITASGRAGYLRESTGTTVP